jgi:precorrin-6B methylase 2
MRFGRRLWVIPGGQTAELADGDVAVELDPGLAFGTGTHATTALCLEWLDSIDLAGRRVIDVGCGSGILAVAALKLGAAHAVAIDHDPQALLATRENAARNGVADRLTVIGADDPPPEPADVVVANILAGTLIELAPRILAMVRSGGRLTLSGILADQAEAVAAAYAVPGGADLEPGRSAALGAHPRPGRSGFSRDGAVAATTAVGIAPEGAPTRDGADFGRSGFSRDGAVTATTAVGIAPEGAPTSDGPDFGRSGFSRDGAVTPPTAVGIAPEDAPTSDAADLGSRAFPGATPGASEASRPGGRSYPASADTLPGRSAALGAIRFSPAVLRDGWALLHGTAGPA